MNYRRDRGLKPLNKLKKNLQILIIILLVSIIIVDISYLIFMVKSLYYAGIISPACTGAACLSLYGKLDKEDYPVWSDPLLVVVISISIAIFLNFIGLLESLVLPIIVSLSAISIILNIIIAALLIYYYKKVISLH